MSATRTRPVSIACDQLLIWPKDAPRPDSNKKLLAFMGWVIREASKDVDVHPKKLNAILATLRRP